MNIRKKGKQLFAVLLSIAMIITTMPLGVVTANAVTAQFAGGSGTEADPYLIETKEHLNNVRNNLNAHYKMMADIVFTDEDFEESGKFYNNGQGWKPIGSKTNAFTGVFDGNGYSIYNLQVYAKGVSSVGLFTTNKGFIKNLGLEHCNINLTLTANGDGYAGGIAGDNYGTIMNCFSSGICIVSGSVGYGYAGGIVGGGNHVGAIIDSCYNLGFVSGSDYASGICGGVNDGEITRCYNAGIIDGSRYVSGITSNNEGLIENSFNCGELIGGSFVGGIVADWNSGYINCCYNVGKITSTDYFGGIVFPSQNSESGTVSSSYYLDNIPAEVGSGRKEGTRCSYGQMQSKDCYLNWDFENIWEFKSNNAFAYPTLRTNPYFMVDSGECGLYGDNVIWQLDSNGTLTFSGEGDMADYSWTNFVPNTPWYQYRSSIKKIVVGSGITSIGDSAFYKLNYVTSIQMLDDVVALGAYSFASCANITEIQLPNNLQQIANYCFEDCSKLVSIVIPNSVSKLGDCSFTGCSKLQNVKLPSNISILPRGVFSECESLETIEIPNSVTEFVSYCFRDCTGLKSIVFPSGLKTIGYRAFSGCTGLEQLIIPNTVTSIGAEAFYDCTGLKRLELPNAITEIPSSLCYGCTNLENIEIPSTVTKIGSSAFSKCTKLSSVALRNGLKEIESSAFYMCINLKCLFVPDSVISIGKNAFGYYKNSYDQPAIIPEARVLCFANTEGEKYAQESNLLYSVIEIDINSADCEYTGMEVVPNVVITIDNVTLKKDADFTVVYENNIDIGTAIVRVNFINDYSHITSTVLKDFRIGKLLSKCEIKLDKDDYQYKMYLPEVTITSDDLTLEINKDYEVYYSLAGETWKKPGANTTKALWALGSCSVKIVGINGYIGEKIITVTVNKFNLQNAKVIVNDNPFDLQNFEYDGTEKKQSNVIVRDSNHNTISNAFYEISYKNNINVGTATMIITGKGEYYTGTIEKHFQIFPRVVSSIQVTKKPNKLTYKKGDSKIDVTGGQITVYYQNGGQETINMTASMLDGDYNLSMDGIQNIWLTYKDCSTYFEVTVKNITRGDCNNDGKITITDMLAVKAHILGKNTLSGDSATAADTNQDGKITITDFIQIKAHILGKSTIAQ